MDPLANAYAIGDVPIILLTILLAALDKPPFPLTIFEDQRVAPGQPCMCSKTLLRVCKLIGFTDRQCATLQNRLRKCWPSPTMRSLSAQDPRHRHALQGSGEKGGLRFSVTMMEVMDALSTMVRPHPYTTCNVWRAALQCVVVYVFDQPACLWRRWQDETLCNRRVLIPRSSYSSAGRRTGSHGC